MPHYPKVAIIGATGAVGRIMIEELAATGRDYDLCLFASEKSEGLKVPYKKTELVVRAFSAERLRGFQYALMSAGGVFSREHSPIIAKNGCIVIDNSSAWRMDNQVPLVVPEVNAAALSNVPRNIIANPNCSTIQMVATLQPLHQAFGLKRVDVSTYQSVSGTGQKGIMELKNQAAQAHRGETLEVQTYANRIYDSLIPAIDKLDLNGHCYEEIKMVQETRKIMEIPDLVVHATTVRVPVQRTHSESITVELGQDVSREDVLKALRLAPGVVLHERDDYADLPYPDTAVNSCLVHVGRVRLPWQSSRSRVVQFWNVADNLYKGAASNAVAILRKLEQVSL